MTNINTAQIRQALDAAGYNEYDPTLESLISCFADCAILYGSDLEELREGVADGSVTVDMMCEYLINES